MAPHRPQCQGSWAPRLHPALAAGSCWYSRHRACFILEWEGKVMGTARAITPSRGLMGASLTLFLLSALPRPWCP